MAITVSEDMTTTAPAQCSEDGCPNKPAARGLCMKHYRRLLRNGSTKTVSGRAKNKGQACSVEGCGRPAKSKGMCTMHYTRWYRTGEVGPADEVDTRTEPMLERIAQRLDTSAGPDGCHPWTGPLTDGYLPSIYVTENGTRSTRSVRRVLAHAHGILEHSDDASLWVKMSDTCHPLCCNTAHMQVTNEARPGTRRGA